MVILIPCEQHRSFFTGHFHLISIMESNKRLGGKKRNSLNLFKLISYIIAARELNSGVTAVMIELLKNDAMKEGHFQLFLVIIIAHLLPFNTYFTYCSLALM